MIYEHLTKAGDSKAASIIKGTTASSPFSSLAKNASSGQAHHSLAVENMLNYGTKKSAVTTPTNNSVPKMQEIFEVKPEVKYSTLALSGNALPQMNSIVSEAFIKQTLMDAEVKKEQPSKGTFTPIKEDYKSLIEGHVETLKHRMTGTVCY